MNAHATRNIIIKRKENIIKSDPIKLTEWADTLYYSPLQKTTRNTSEITSVK